MISVEATQKYTKEEVEWLRGRELDTVKNIYEGGPSTKSWWVDE